jgi:histidine kinase/DNA gyrase B/HSP90-like ATPase
MKHYRKRIPPSAFMIHGMIYADGFNPKKVIGELTANSLGAGASQIDISYSRKSGEFVISDNGHGADLEKMVEIGLHYNPNGRKTIGVHGVGFKDAVIWLGDEVFVSTMDEAGHKSSVYADWNQMMKEADWQFDFQEYGPHDKFERTLPGVTITVRRLRTGRLLDADNEFRKAIPELFSAAIDMGVVITYNGEVIPALPFPDLEDETEFDGCFGIDSNGEPMLFSGRCGILKSKKGVRSGWEIRWNNLTIEKGYQKEGFGDYSPQGFYGQILLSGGKWHVSRNKTEVEEMPELVNLEDIQKIIVPILEKLKARSEAVLINTNRRFAQAICAHLVSKLRVSISEDGDQEIKTPKEPTHVKPGDEHGEGGRDGGREGRHQESNNKDDKIKKIRRRKKVKSDAAGKLNRKLQMAQDLRIEQHETPDQYGLGYVDFVNEGRNVKIFIDFSTPAGKHLWKEKEVGLLAYHAVAILAKDCGLKDAPDAWKFASIGEGDSEDLRLAKLWLWLLEQTKLHELEFKDLRAA